VLTNIVASSQRAEKMAENQDCSKMLEFKLFSRLATELQLNIWKLAIPEPRIVSKYEPK
jgi:hypothetical protein